MALRLNQTQCCGLQEIAMIKDHKTPTDVMKEFCKKVWQSSRYDYNTHAYVDTPELRNKMYGLYLFTGVVSYTKGRRIAGMGGPKYANNFAAFIRKNGLGDVRASVPGPNRVNHPTHMVRAFIWTPKPNKVKAWYRKNVLNVAKKAKVNNPPAAVAVPNWVV